MSDRKIRVLHIIKSLGRGGAETLLVQGLKTANRDRFEYEFAYFLPWKDALVRELEEHGVRVTCIEAKSSGAVVAAVPRLARHIRERKPDIVHCHLPVAGIAGRLAARLNGIPAVYSEHNLMERYHPWTRRAHLATWGLNRHVIACSKEVATSASSHAGDRVPITVVQNGVCLETFQRDTAAGLRVREELNIGPDATVVGTCAVFRTQKALDIWLAAASRAMTARPDFDWQFILVGDGPLRTEVEEVVAQLGLGDHVHLVGMQDDVRPYLSAMNVFMMSSRFEGLPVALLEAMACELPVVSTTVGGIPEVVEEGVCGRLVDTVSAAALCDALVGLVAETDLGVGGRAARARVAEQFSMARMTGELEAVYESALG